MFVDAAASDLHLAPGSPLVDAGIDVGLPFLGAAPDLGAYEAGGDLMTGVRSLAASFQAMPPAAFRNAAEQRSNALQQKIFAFLNDLSAIRAMTSPAGQLAAYRGALDKLDNDIWAKADGFYGGKPANDWITTQAEQARLYQKVTAIRQMIEAEIARPTAARWRDSRGRGRSPGIDADGYSRTSAARGWPGQRTTEARQRAPGRRLVRGGDR